MLLLCDQAQRLQLKGPESPDGLRPLRLAFLKVVLKRHTTRRDTPRKTAF